MKLKLNALEPSLTLEAENSAEEAQLREFNTLSKKQDVGSLIRDNEMHPVAVKLRVRNEPPATQPSTETFD